MEEDSKRELLIQNCYTAVILWVICLADKKHKYLRDLPGLVSWIKKTMLGNWIYYFYIYALAWNLVLNSGPECFKKQQS